MKLLVGVAGRKGHGKDAVAGVLLRHGFVKHRFADPLKAMLRAFYRCNDLDEATIQRKIEGELKEAPCAMLCGRTPREAMQTLGTEWGRGLVHPDLWTESLERRVASFDRVVVPDVRFPNEIKTIRANGGVVLYVDAGRRIGQGAFTDHKSETGVGAHQADFNIKNDGSPADLEDRVNEVLRALLTNAEE